MEKKSPTYFLAIHYHPERKLVFVSQHKTDTKTGITTAVSYSKAKWAYNSLKNGESTRAVNKTFDSGFCCALLNVGLEGWLDHNTNKKDYDTRQIAKLKNRFYNFFESKDFIISGSRNTQYRDASKSGIDNWGKKLPNLGAMKKEQIDNRVNKMLVGLNLDNNLIKKIRNEIYSAAVETPKYRGNNAVIFNYWGDVFLFIHEHFDLGAKL